MPLSREPSALEVGARLRSGDQSVEEYAKSLLATVRERNNEIHAWAHLDPEQVLSTAKELDQVPHGQRGPLFGLPVGIKDVFLSQGMTISPQFTLRLII